jgi:hypothetical protein
VRLRYAQALAVTPAIPSLWGPSHTIPDEGRKLSIAQWGTWRPDELHQPAEFTQEEPSVQQWTPPVACHWNANHDCADAKIWSGYFTVAFSTTRAMATQLAEKTALQFMIRLGHGLVTRQPDKSHVILSPHKALHRLKLSIEDNRVDSTHCGAGDRTDMQLGVWNDGANYVVQAYVATDYALGTYDPDKTHAWVSRRIVVQMRGIGSVRQREKCQGFFHNAWKNVSQRANDFATTYAIERALLAQDVNQL